MERKVLYCGEVSVTVRMINVREHCTVEQNFAEATWNPTCFISWQSTLSEVFRSFPFKSFLYYRTNVKLQCTVDVLWNTQRQSKVCWQSCRMIGKRPHIYIYIYYYYYYYNIILKSFVFFVGGLGVYVTSLRYLMLFHRGNIFEHFYV